jgi:hypothetical protein
MNGPAGLPTATSTGEELPPWAAGVMSSVGTLSEAYAGGVIVSDYKERLDQDTGISFFEGPGVYVVAVDKPTRQTLGHAIQLLRRLKTQPLDVAALAMPEQMKLPANEVNELATVGIIVARLAAESAHARAVKFITQFLASREDGMQHLHQFARSSLATPKTSHPSLKRIR